MEPTSTKPSQLSCTNCRHRKVKCDKSSPCSACRRSNIECVFPTRPFKPRGRQGGSRARNVEITKRLNRLEGLMSKLGGEGAANAMLQEAQARDQSSMPRTFRHSSSDSPGVQDEKIMKPDGHASSDFWSSLSGEVSLPGMLLSLGSFPLRVRLRYGCSTGGGLEFSKTLKILNLRSWVAFRRTLDEMNNCADSSMVETTCLTPAALNTQSISH